MISSQHLEQRRDRSDAVGGRVDADHRVAAAIEQPVENAGGDARGSSVGWLGCSRVESRPGSPMVSRKRVTTRHLLRDQDQVLLAHDLRTAATISGRQARRERGQRLFRSAASDSSQSRNSPTVRC